MNINNYFQKEPQELLDAWDGIIQLESVPGRLDWKVLTKPIPCGNGWIPVPFEYDGSSSGIFRFMIPKWRHPIASGRHDWRAYLLRQMRASGMAMKKIKYLRKISDQLYKEDLKIGQTNKIRSVFETNVGYSGVRIGAFFGIGMRNKS